jgi:hypothetical protein
MKKLVLTAVASLACLAAFAQGKISFQNNSAHLVYYDPSRVSDVSLAGGAVFNGVLNGTNGMPTGYTLMGDLYIGTSSSSLSLISSTTFSASPGAFSSMSVQVPGIVGGTSVFVVAQVRDSASTPEAVWTPGFQGAGLNWYGASSEFSFVLGTSAIAYPAMWSTAGTWAAGSWPMGQYGPNYTGAIAVAPVPEPTSFALMGLGAASLLIFRRRK